MAETIDGKAIAAKIQNELCKRVSILGGKGIKPLLAVVLAGENPASLSYIRGKKKALASAGMESRDFLLPETTAEEEILSIINSLNSDRLVHGILVQLPLPAHISEDKIISAIDPDKDVDGFHPVSAGNMFLGKNCFLPCTPNGIIRLLNEMKVPLSGRHAVILGRSNIVGKPLAMLLCRKENNATVTICHTGTKNLKEITLQADILIAAAGQPEMVNADMIRDGAVVIDVGVNRVPDSTKKKGYRLCGDVDFDAVAKKASMITPVPGGVGPMTITMLMENLVIAAEKKS